MTIHSAGGQRCDSRPLFPPINTPKMTNRIPGSPKRWMFLAGLVVFASAVIAQNAPQITSVDPSSGKVNDAVVVSGSNLGKGSVASVYLSDDKNDYKATIVSQNDDKITVKVPQVKPGDYNVSLEVGDKLFIKPVKFKVEQ
jgi:IPT/TIG domain